MMVLQNALLAVAFTASYGFSTPWALDKDHSIANFKIRHMVVTNTTGAFLFSDGKFDLDDADFTKSTLEATLDVKSINTNNSKRDDHLRSPDFLNAPKFPVMKFVSKKIIPSSGGFKVTGDFTLHGITKEVTLDALKPTDTAKDGSGNLHRGLAFTGKVTRKDFGITYNKALETGGLAVGEEVDVSIEIELLQKPLKIDKKS